MLQNWLRGYVIFQTTMTPTYTHALVNCVTMPELAKNKQYNGEKSPGNSEKNVKMDPLIDIKSAASENVRV